MANSTKAVRRATPPFTATVAREVDEMRNRIRRFFEEPLGRVLSEPFTPELYPTTVGWIPTVEVAETDDAFVVTAELPGLERKDVRVEFDNGVLTIAGEKQEEQKTEEERYHVWERTYGTFQRSFMLPAPVNEDQVTAEMRNGVLRVTLPKTVEAKTKAHRIEITEKK